MIRTQVQLPDALYRDAKRIAQEQEMPLAEVVRRGLEHMRQLYPPRQHDRDGWTLPLAKSLGAFRMPHGGWREAANRPPAASKS